MANSGLNQLMKHRLKGAISELKEVRAKSRLTRIDDFNMETAIRSATMVLSKRGGGPKK